MTHYDKLLGAIAAGMLIAYLLRDNIKHWWWMNRPVVCKECGKTVSIKNSCNVLHNVHGSCTLCNECYDKIYTPWWEQDNE